MTQLCVIDVETTGLSPETARITEVALIICDENQILSHWSTLIQPEMPIPEMISKITGITDEMVRNAPKFAQVATLIADGFKDRTFVAHNSNFDYGFLRAEYKRIGQEFQVPQLCTVRASRKIFPGLTSYKLSSLCEKFQIENKQAHRALADAMATAQLFQLVAREATKQGFDWTTLKNNIN